LEEKKKKKKFQGGAPKRDIVLSAAIGALFGLSSRGDCGDGAGVWEKRNSGCGRSLDWGSDFGQHGIGSDI
jgi:hypothetical protein